MENAGTIDIFLEQCELSDVDFSSDAKPVEYLRLRVSDTGEGIPEDIQGRIFDPYFTTKETGKGSGMGLSVVHGIVKSHEGLITFDSKPGDGTTFSIYFPKISRAAEKKEAPKEKIPAYGNERILIVDDDIAIVELNKKRLQRLGYQVTDFSNSREALDFFTSNPDSFDLIISDQTMPGLTGDKLAQAIRSIRSDLPIIIISGYSSILTPEKAALSGINAFLVKPVANDELLRTIRRLLDESIS